MLLEPFLERFALQFFECVNSIENRCAEEAKKHAEDFWQANVRYFY